MQGCLAFLISWAIQLLPLLSQVCTPQLLSSEHDWASFPCSCPAQLICSCTGSLLVPELWCVPSLVSQEHRISFALPSNICLFSAPVCGELWGKRAAGKRLLVPEHFLQLGLNHLFPPRFPWVGTESGRGWMDSLGGSNPLLAGHLPSGSPEAPVPLRKDLSGLCQGKGYAKVRSLL